MTQIGVPGAFRDPDDLLNRAMQHDRVAAEAIWRDIANGGQAFVEDTRWIHHVALKIVRDIIDGTAESKSRPQFALQALELAGPRNIDPDLYDELIASQTFRDWGNPAAETLSEEGRNLSRTKIAEDFVRSKLLSPTSNFRAAAKKLDRIAKKARDRDR